MIGLLLLLVAGDAETAHALIRRRCVSCHGAEKQEGSLRLDSRDAALKGGDGGPAVVPGKPSDGLLMRAVRHRGGLKMPPKEKLSEDEASLLERWIRGGAPWAAPAASSPQRRLGDAWSDPENPVRRAFGGARLDLWSLRPLADPKPPPLRHEEGVHGDVDRFIRARLEDAGIPPSREAPRGVLLRRLAFDLTGLPPTPEEVRDFEGDPRPDAVERRVDRLLASPEFGVRWARHWLDVVRYADTHGFERDEYKPQMYRYRDWVVRALNADLPFERFVRMQIAGDEMVPPEGPRDAADADAIVAAGFLRLGTYDSTGDLFQEQAKARNEFLGDLANTVGSAFLGLTISCANCHDHKYDPVTQADHFRLRAFFATASKKDDTVLDGPAERARIAAQHREADAAAAAIQREIDALLAPFRGTPKTSEADAAKLLDEAGKRALKELGERKAAEERRKPPYTTAYSVRNTGGKPPETRIFYQGDFNEPREAVTAGFLSVLDPNPAPAAPGGPRSALADWLAAPEHPLVARVFVNRAWQHLFGRGLVATPNDFGFSGSAPTHPELLDRLARDFRAEGGSLKRLLRTLVLSATYRQASAWDAERAAKDPENRLLWRRAPRRLEAEAMRDAMLSVAGLLRPCAGGPPRWPPVPQEILDAQPGILETHSDENARKRLQGWYATTEEDCDVRSLFLIQKRALALPFLEPFDLPDPTVSCGKRDVTVVAPQALHQLNSGFSARVSRAFAASVEREAGADPAAQVRRALERAWSRPARPEEERIGRRLAERAGLAAWCRVLLNANEFVFID
jgi:hypothetical protein